MLKNRRKASTFDANQRIFCELTMSAEENHIINSDVAKIVESSQIVRSMTLQDTQIINVSIVLPSFVGTHLPILSTP